MSIIGKVMMVFMTIYAGLAGFGADDVQEEYVFKDQRPTKHACRVIAVTGALNIAIQGALDIIFVEYSDYSTKKSSANKIEEGDTPILKNSFDPLHTEFDNTNYAYNSSFISSRLKFFNDYNSFHR